jgi:serine phosphatase RsbU (regulator of sigma subunit)/anti-sigma regulatory factor (Ser/Thr protein kinase)
LPFFTNSSKVYQIDPPLPALSEPVLSMTDLLRQHASRLVTLWKELTGEDLFAWNEKALPPVPEPVLHAFHLALAGEQPAVPFQVEGSSWIGVRSQRSAEPFFLISRAPAQGDLSLLALLASLLDELAVEKDASRQLQEELLSAWNRLNFLYEMARIAIQQDDLPQVFTRLIRSLLQVIQVEDICLVLENGPSLQVFTASGRQIPALEGLAPYAGQPGPIHVLVSETTLPGTLQAVKPEIHSLVLLTMNLEGQARGLLGLINPPGGVLKVSDSQLLHSTVEQISMLINSTLARTVQEASRRLEHELQIASQIQANFLPRSLPELPELEFAVKLKPAHHIGGDFYDVQPVAGGLAIMAGDVAGKGIPAAMLTSLVHATLKSEAQYHQEPAQLLRSINRLIYGELDRSDTFITAFLAVLETSPLRLSYASAGHTSALLWQNAAHTVQQLPSTGLPLGVTPDLDLEECSLDLNPGDTLILYSDGITEAENVSGRVFGTQGLIDLVFAGQSAPAAEHLNMILTALDLHRGGLALKDDVVLFLARALSSQDSTLVTPFVYPAEKSSVRSLALLARQMASEIKFANLSQRSVYLNELELAVSEIATNVVVHAYRGLPFAGRLQGRITVAPQQVTLDLIDNGHPFQPSSRRRDYSLHDPPVGGYGLLIARRLLNVCSYTQLGEGRNHWHLEKRVPERR